MTGSWDDEHAMRRAHRTTCHSEGRRVSSFGLSSRRWRKAVRRSCSDGGRKADIGDSSCLRMTGFGGDAAQ